MLLARKRLPNRQDADQYVNALALEEAHMRCVGTSPDGLSGNVLNLTWPHGISTGQEEPQAVQVQMVRMARAYEQRR